MIALAEAVSQGLAAEFGGRVIKFDQPATVKQADPEGEVERLADVHRRLVLKYSSRIAETKRALKATITSLEDERKAVKIRFEADLAAVIEKIADVRDKANRDTEADKKLIAASKAALDTLAD